MSAAVNLVTAFLTSFVLALIIAAQFWFFWNGIAPKYFYWLPSVYLQIPFWDCVWLALAISALKVILLPASWSKSK